MKHTLSALQTKDRLSTLWICVLITMLVRDIHELFRPGLLEEMMSGTVNGVAMTETTLLAAGIVLELAVVMIILSKVLPYTINRWLNLLLAPLMIVFMFVSGPADLDDLFFRGMQIIFLTSLMWLAWRWPSLTSNTLMTETIKRA